MSTRASSGPLCELRAELMRFAPFAQMAPAEVDRFVASCEPVHYEPGALVLAPAGGAVTQLLYIRRGSVSGRRGMADSGSSFEYQAGDLFPVGAALGARAVTATYTATTATDCLQLPVAAMHALVRDSAPFADFLNRRVQQFLDLSRRALQAAYASQSLAEQSLETPLGALLRRAAYGVPPSTPLAEALRAMHDKRIGSVLVLDELSGAALGILTRHDILGRVTLPGVALDTPIGEVMSQPVHTLSTRHTAQDAALLMSRFGIRHVPVAGEEGRVVGILSERDLFALQRLSLKHLSTAIRAADDTRTLVALAPDIRRFARNLLGQGVNARQLTELISRLNDLLTERLVELVARSRALDLGKACWIAFGSEGRSEQTIATDQDNGLLFESDDPERDRPAWLAFGREVNELLDACGYPLCKGNVMASNPECCLTAGEWVTRFRDWIDQGAPEDLLNASIYFDFRALAGRLDLVAPLVAQVRSGQAPAPRFMRQLAENALRNRVPLGWPGWLGSIDADIVEGRKVIDLKMNGTAIFVDAARLFALAHGLAATGTRERLQAAALRMGVPAREAEAWVTAFEYLQMLRLRVQLLRGSPGDGGAEGEVHPNRLELGSLNDLDLRLLKDTLRVARQLQQRMELDYLR